MWIEELPSICQSQGMYSILSLSEGFGTTYLFLRLSIKVCEAYSTQWCCLGSPGSLAGCEGNMHPVRLRNCQSMKKLQPAAIKCWTRRGRSRAEPCWSQEQVLTQGHCAQGLGRVRLHTHG